MFIHRQSTLVEWEEVGFFLSRIICARFLDFLIYITNEKKEVQSSPNSSFDNLYTWYVDPIKKI
jgi:hypothetical protein